MHVTLISDDKVSVVNEQTREVSYVFWSTSEEGLMKAYENAENLCKKLNK